jgi:hypothetical protein
MSASIAKVIAAHAKSSGHRAEIEASDLCGCFYCKSVFKPTEITEWIDWPKDTPEGLESARGTTAMCPRCGIDSVIGSASGYPITVAFMSEMRRYWF